MFLETDVCIKVVEKIKWRKMYFQLHTTIIMFLSPTTIIKRFDTKICNEMTLFVQFCGVLFNDPSVRMLKTYNLVNWDSYPVSHISSMDYLPLSVNVNKKMPCIGHVLQINAQTIQFDRFFVSWDFRYH